MKKFLALVLSFVLALGVLASSINPPKGFDINPPKGFDGEVWNSTLALYAAKQIDPDGATRLHFVCTAEPIEKIPGGYEIMSAGHCVHLIPDGVQFSVSDEIGGPRTPVQLIKAVYKDGIDFSLFALKTTKVYPVIAMDLKMNLQIGDKVAIGNFTQGLGKQLSYGVVASAFLPESEVCTTDVVCTGDFMVQAFGGPGASGSAVISERTHKIVGLGVFGFEGTLGFGVEPISKFTTFMAGPNQPHALDEEEAGGPQSPAATQPTIPADVFAAQFGEAHPFTLTVTGPSPTFTQGGYTFQVQSSGFELSDEYYYDVPVFIGQTDDEYRLVSTKAPGYSIQVLIVSVGK